jgi:hypothetical protein
MDRLIFTDCSCGLASFHGLMMQAGIVMPSFGPDPILTNDFALVLSPLPGDDPISLERGGSR